MAARAFWSGYLKLSLVTCPVAMMPVRRDSGALHFHTLNRRTGHRVLSRYVDALDGRPVADDDQVLGYPRDEESYVLLEDAELDAVALDSTHTIDVTQFVPAGQVGLVWYDTPHFLLPDDPVGAEAFAVIRAAMAAGNMVGISRLVLYRRERAVLLEPRDRGMVLWTLHYGNEVRDAADYFAPVEDGYGRAEMGLLQKLIDRQSRPWDPDMLDDPVREKLLEMIAARHRGRRRAKADAAPAPGGQVVSIMDALRASLEETGGDESGKGKRRKRS